MNFFKKVKLAITNFESYQTFAKENTFKAIQYFLIIVLIFSIFATIGITYNVYNVIQSGELETMLKDIELQNFPTQEVLDVVNQTEPYQLIMSLFLFMLVYLTITYTLVIMLDVLILSLLAYLTTKLYKVGLKYKECFNMAIYALTLPILLNAIYIVVNSFTGFTIEYFQIMYNVVSYIYIITAILIIKADIDKTASDALLVEEAKIEKQEEEQEVEEEPTKEKNENKKDKTDKEKGSPEPGQA